MSASLSTQLLLKSIQTVEPFTGADEQDPTSWLQTIDELFDATKVTHTDRRLLLPLCFGEDVKKWYRSEQHSQEYVEFKKQFVNAFTSSIYQLKISTKLMNRRQGVEETVQTYYFDTLSLCTRYNAQMEDKEKLLYLLRGLKPSIQQQVIMNDPKSCQELFEHAKRAEAAAIIGQSSFGVPTASPDQMEETTAALRRSTISTNSRRSDNQMENSRGASYGSSGWQSQSNYNRSSHTRPLGRASQLVCYTCHGIGHYARQCPSYLN